MRDALGDVQSIVVLGGRSEIALATVRALAQHRLARVVLAVRDIQAAKSDADALRSEGLTVDVVAFDAAKIDHHTEMIEAIFASPAAAHDVDVVLVAFGVLGDQDIADHDAAHALNIVTTNFNGAVSVMVPIAQRLALQGHGTIAVLSSVAAVRPRRANFVYASSKAGLDSFTSGLADAYAGTGVHVMTVRPGFVHTNMTKGLEAAPFATTPDVVANAIVAGIRRRQSTVYAPSVLRFVMPVLAAVPRVIWRKMR